MPSGLGILIVTISTAFYGLINPLLKKANNDSIPPFTVMAISMFVLFLCSFFASIFFENGLHIKGDILKSNSGYLILAGVINFIAFWFAILGFKYMPLWQQTLFSLMMPVFTAIFAYFLLGEKLSLNFFLGLLIMGIGLFIVGR